MNRFHSFQQVAYVPFYVTRTGNFLKDEDVEFGFVVTGIPDASGNIWARFWKKGSPGILYTTSCSVSTPQSSLIPYECIHWSKVLDVVREYKIMDSIARHDLSLVVMEDDFPFISEIGGRHGSN